MSPIKPVDAKDPDDYIAQIDVPDRKADIVELDRMIREIAPELERRLESGMLGYGRYRYRYASGREGEWCVIGLASQKRYVSLYACATPTSARAACASNGLRMSIQRSSRT